MTPEELDAEERTFEAILTEMRAREDYFATKESAEFMRGMREARWGFNHVYGVWQMHNKRGAWKR